MLEKTLVMVKRTIEIIVYIMLSLMTIMIGWEVFTRFVFDVTPAWLNQMTLLFMVWVGIIGIAYGFHEQSHIRIIFLTRKFPIIIQNILDQFSRLLTLLFGLYMFFQGGKFALKMSHSLLSGVPLPTTVLYASVPISGILIVFFVIAEIFTENKNTKKGGLE